MKVDILAIGVHPDDVELSASGTLLKHAALGRSFGLLDLTRGELGTRGDAETRAEEGRAAAKILGASFREMLDLEDGFFAYNPDNIKKIIRVIRRWRPEIVLCNAPDDRHPDHGRASRLCADACFYSGLRKIETFDDTKSQEAWRPNNVFHYIQDKQLTPDFVVDITPYFQQKMQAVMAFKTQFYTPDMDGPSTPISGKDFVDFLEAKARVFGRPVGYELAEGFLNTRTPGVVNFFDLQ